MDSGTFVQEVAGGERAPIAQVARELGLSPSTVFRWTTIGCHGHKLRALKIGSKTYITRAALQEFFDATNNRHPSLTARVSPAVFDRSRRRSIENAKRDVEASGVRRRRPARAAS